MKTAFFPTTKLGKIGFCLIVLAFLFFGAFFFILSLFDPQGNGSTGFFSVPALAIPLLGVWTAGTASFFCSLISMIFRKERSLAMGVPLLLGGFILWFGFSEMIWGG